MTNTTFHHTRRPGFLLGFVDFFTAGLFFLFYMPLGGLQDEIETILGHKVQPYWKAYLWGIPTAFIYTLVWMARIAEERMFPPFYTDCGKNTHRSYSVAYELGFPEQFTFRKYFKSHTGQSPTEYQQAQKTDGINNDK